MGMKVCWSVELMNSHETVVKKNIISVAYKCLLVVLRCSNLILHRERSSPSLRQPRASVNCHVKVFASQIVCLANQKDRYSFCMFSVSSQYMGRRKLRVWEIENEIFMNLEGAKCSQFLICQQWLTQTNILTGIHWQREKRDQKLWLRASKRLKQMLPLLLLDR